MHASSDIAVSVATLNRPDGLARCLDAVLSSEPAPAEVVVVDQGDDIRTAVVVSQREGHGRITYIQQRRAGLSASRNLALASVSSPVLATTDDDCVPAPGWLAAIGRAFAESPTPQSVTGRVLPLGPHQDGLVAISSRSSTVRADVQGNTAPWTAGTGANVAVDRSWAERIGGWDERLGSGSDGGAGEDVDFLYRLLEAGGRIRYEPEALIRHARAPLERRRATRLSYGRGVGACCGLYLRNGDPGGARLLAQWTALRMRMAARALTHGERAALGEELLVARGTAAGLVYGLRAGR